MPITTMISVISVFVGRLQITASTTQAGPVIRVLILFLSLSCC